MGARTKAIFIPVGERDHLIGDAELMGFSGKRTQETLNAFFYDRGYVPFCEDGKYRIHLKSEVYKWMQEHTVKRPNVRKEYKI